MDFKLFIKNTLSAEMYEHFHTSMGITLTRKTHILNDPQRMRSDEIKELVNIINCKDVTAEYLISAYSCGRNVLTLAQLEELTVKPA